MPRLDIIIGPMFAGKSCEIIRMVRLLKVCEKDYLIVKPKIDNRYSSDEIVSHNYDKEKCIAIQNLTDIYSYCKSYHNTIFIDEAQFFKDLKEQVLNLVENLNYNVVITGLDGDSNRNKFGQVLDLIPYADSCKKITALCQICKDGTPGIFSYRKSSDESQILIGAKDEYMTVCRKHYFNT
uniref:thymidine kinase n=1 Tax=viral metagenome TaxID=1070528 RepID=A0A6C0J469_9ZZZZ